MTLDDVLRNPTLRRALAAGEEQVGKVVSRLLASERVNAGLRGVLDGALHARRTIGRGLEQALHAANLPSREDVAALRQRVAELEAALDGLEARVGSPRLDGEPPGPPGPPPDRSPR
jgi:hypothetical protein